MPWVSMARATLDPTMSDAVDADDSVFGNFDAQTILAEPPTRLREG